MSIIKDFLTSPSRLKKLLRLKSKILLKLSITTQLIICLKLKNIRKLHSKSWINFHILGDLRNFSRLHQQEIFWISLKNAIDWKENWSLTRNYHDFKKMQENAMTICLNCHHLIFKNSKMIDLVYFIKYQYFLLITSFEYIYISLMTLNSYLVNLNP